MKNNLFLFVFFACIFTQTSIAQEIPNFGIEGWAKNTIGGRGGNIIRVTNLNATGAGSFADAVGKNEPRIIVFEVGGVIDLLGKKLVIKNPYITIAGQTSPGDGITLINGGLFIEGHDIIIQHIRIRPGSFGHEVGWEPDGLSTYGAYNVIIDHCSFTWAVDENCSVSGPRFEGATPDDWRENTSHTVTISNNIIAEGLSNSTHSSGEHSKGSLIHDNVTDIAVLSNLYASNNDRSPIFKGGARGVIANNYIYNPGSAALSYNLSDSEWAGYAQQTGMISIIGNYLKSGPDTNERTVDFFKHSNGPLEVYLEDNISEKRSGTTEVNEYKGDTSKIVSSEPIWNDNINVIASYDVEQEVANNVGATPWNRDYIDSRIVNEALAGTGTIIDDEAEVGGYPSYSLSSENFIESEWNLDYMIKISQDISVNATTDKADLVVESVLNNSISTYTDLELFINNVSYGTITQSPYKWDVDIETSGDFELLVVASSDGEMNLVSTTNTVSIQSEKEVWNFSDNTTWPISSGASDSIVDNLALVPGSGITNFAAVSTNTQNFSDGFSSTQRLLMNGAGLGGGIVPEDDEVYIPTKRYMEFAVNGDCTIKVWLRGSTGSTRTLYITDGTSVVGKFETTDSSNQIAAIDYTGGATNLYVFSIGNGLTLYKIEVGTMSIQSQNKVWNFSDNTTWPITAGQSESIIDNLAFVPGGTTTNFAAISANVQNFPDGFQSSQRLLMNGAGMSSGIVPEVDEEYTPTKRYMYFAASGDCTVKVWLRGSSGTRTLYITDGTSVVGKFETTDSSNQIATIDYTGGATNLYIFSIGNGLTLYKIEVESETELNTTSFSLNSKPDGVLTNVYSSGDTIYVSNVKTPSEINIYNISGVLVKALKTNDDMSFTLKSGLYIANVVTSEGQKSVKLLIAN